MSQENTITKYAQAPDFKLNSLSTGTHYLLDGARLIAHPKLRLFVLVPMLINIALFFVLTTLLIQQFSGVIDWFMAWLPSLPQWLPEGIASILSGLLSVLTGIIWILFVAITLLIYGYSFSIITNLIAAPFYGVLAERVETLVTGQTLSSEPLSQLIPRTIGRELSKLWYFITRGLLVAVGILLISWVPLLGLLGPLIGLLWGAWCMAIQYVDYSADNHQLSFAGMRRRLKAQKYSSCGLGGLTILGTMIPVVNIFVMPAAVAGGTLYWISELKDQR